MQYQFPHVIESEMITQNNTVDVELDGIRSCRIAFSSPVQQFQYDVALADMAKQ